MARNPSHNISLLFADLDGTLLDGRSELTAESRRAARECAAAGIAVVIATARPPRSTRRLYEMLQLDTPSIHYNGALVYDFSTESVLLHRPIPGALARELAQRTLEIDGSAVISLEVCDRWYLNRMSEHLATQTEREGFRPDYVGDLERCFDQPVTKVLMSFPGSRMHEADELLRGTFSGRLEFTKTDECVLQVMNGGVSKGSAAQYVCRLLGVAGEAAAAIGDAPNDVPMFQVVGMSIAMANGYPETRAAADHVTLANDEDGAAAAMRKFILGKSSHK